MGRRVDAAGKAGQHGHALVNEKARHPVCPAQAIRACLPYPDDRDGQRVIGAQCPLVEQERREVEDRAQVDRVILVEDGRQLDAVGLCAREHPLDNALPLAEVVSCGG